MNGGLMWHTEGYLCPLLRYCCLLAIITRFKEVWASVDANNELGILIQNILDVTEEDVFWSTRKELDIIIQGLKRGKAS